MAGSVGEELRTWQGISRDKRNKKLISLITLTILLILWKKRNIRAVEEICYCFDKVWFKIFSFYSMATCLIQGKIQRVNWHLDKSTFCIFVHIFLYFGGTAFVLSNFCFEDWVAKWNTDDFKDVLWEKIK